MIQVIKRTEQILEFLSADPDRGRHLSDIAFALGVHNSTVANILKSMMELDLVEQPVPRGGYYLGPKLFHLARKGPYRRKIARAAEPHVKKLASDLNASVLIAVVRQGKRFILCNAEGNSIMQMKEEFLYREDIFSSATGRLLLSAMEQDEVENILAEQGLPSKKDWADATTLKKMEKELNRIQKEQKVIIPHPEVGGMSVPIKINGMTVAALGIILPELRTGSRPKPSSLKKIEQAAAAISKAVSK